MLKSICSSKLYIASSRKDRIHATMLAPGNLSLVQQLAEDLDEEYQIPENLGQVTPQPEEKASEGYDDLIVDEEINPETDLMTVDDLAQSNESINKHSSAPSHASAPAPKPESEKPEDNTSELMPESPANEVPAKEEPEATEASTKIESTTVVKPEQLVNLDVLKGSLNSVDGLAGVTRIALKEKEQEIWIYYNDNTNLNNILANVIEYVMNNNFGPLEFNRLARSDNAVVFSISFQSAKQLRSVEQAIEENKE